METAYANINGQIWLFCDAVVEWELVEDTEQHVTVRVLHHDLGKHMMMTFVYEKCSAMERLELWDHLNYLASDMKLTWLVGGDFNVILHEDENIGGLPNWIRTCAIVNDMWGADHQFCQAFQKLKRMKAALSKWSRETFGDIFKKLAILEDIVRVKEMLFEEEPTIENRIVLQKAQSELKKYLSIEEKYWKQKAGMTWFAEGDRNTSFFQNYVNGKRKKLQLKRIKSGSGVWIEYQE
ncbi:PREDICTED: uncharacterized protein LOC109220196 [Nicotiana attenuata]|uniref:uncharacterized protein LOC109220196 n=1 Tax=Nicotiana attenuata TaxID=49451 RepID=UPI000904BE4F|nr:PREDICTED: uncharacterized protein LOC109220196 [Nicotiana attenuata]